METIGIARRLMELGQVEKAREAFELALQLGEGSAPADKMEAALAVLQYGGDYKLSYQAFLDLNHEGQYREETAAIMTEAFYLPNEKELRTRYELNCKKLKKYKYIFRKDFLSFEELSIRFYPFDDKSYIPYQEDKFGDITDYNEPVISRNFFHNLENPILAKDVYSQYELEYLNDNVRPSEWVSRDNHIYLHYSNWAEFCAYLQVLNFRKLLVDQKIVFLIEDEAARYPIDFKIEFGIDYSDFPLRPVGLREINRLIWHTQLSYHNGGDFFNEVLDGHPNLICSSSIMNDSMENTIADIRSTLDDAHNLREIEAVFDENDWGDSRVIHELYLLKDRTDKDIFVAYFFRDKEHTHTLDPASRIAPAILYQPHFGYVDCELVCDSEGRAVMSSTQLEAMRDSPVFRNFKYIKTFTPMRRITTSYAAAVRFMVQQLAEMDETNASVIKDEIINRVTFRGYLYNEDDRLFKDSVIVRFEDAKQNPKATFMALIDFLDIPFSETMRCCTYCGVPIYQLNGYAVGFDEAPIYRTYEEFASEEERYYLEYFLRDAYDFYGYDLHYYDGTAVTEDKAKELITNFHIADKYINESMRLWYRKNLLDAQNRKTVLYHNVNDLSLDKEVDILLKKFWADTYSNRLFTTQLLMRGLEFVNESGYPLKYIPLLKLNPELQVKPLYH